MTLQAADTTEQVFETAALTLPAVTQTCLSKYAGHWGLLATISRYTASPKNESNCHKLDKIILKLIW